MRVLRLIVLIGSMLSSAQAIESDVALPASSEEPTVVAQTEQTASYQLMLFGSAAAICSSAKPEYCQPESSFATDAKTAALFALNPTQLQLLASANIFNAERQALQQQLLDLLAQLQLHTPKPLHYAELVQLWRNHNTNASHATDDAARADVATLSGEQIWQQLSERELSAVFDYLEVPQFTADNRYRLTEQVSIPQQSNDTSLQLYQQFVQMAAAHAAATDKQKPTILVLTAAASDPFASVDFYLDVFNQLGATSSWLPLSAAYQSARQLADCKTLPQLIVEKQQRYRRDSIYPDRFKALQQLCEQAPKQVIHAISQADAIYITDGDPALLLAALKHPDGTDSPELAAIRTALNNKTLLLGAAGSSAAALSGTLITDTAKHIPVISNGDSYHALQYGSKAAAAPRLGCKKEHACPQGLSERQLTFLDNGGLGFFAFGIVDTYMAERGRQGRLLVLQQEQQIPLGFGIDENTALLVDLNPTTENIATFAVSGAGGVLVSERLTDSSAQLLQAKQHYASAGDTLQLTAQAIMLQPAADKTMLTALAATLQTKSPLFAKDNFQEFSFSLCRSNLASATVSEPPYLIRIAKSAQCYQSPNGQLSYQQLLRIVSPAS